MPNTQGRLVLFLTATLLTGPVAATRAEGHREQIATSCEDCPSYSGAFSITNETGVPIKYQVRWGDHSKWGRIILQTGHVETHRYPLGADPATRVPTPFVRFDDVGGDKEVSFHEVRMQFHAVGYAGYGPKANTTEPKHYHFTYLGDGRHLDLQSD